MAKEPARNKKIQVPVRLDDATFDRLKNLIYWTGKGRTIQSILEAGLMAELERIEREENRGKPFAARPEGH